MRREVEERFTPERMVADYVAAYEAALAARVSFRRSPYDGEILRLAVPALGSLAAEPLYILVDTAIVGHLGRPQLAALGIAAVVLSGALRDLQLPPVRDDGAGRARVGGRGGATARRLGAPVAVALAGRRHGAHGARDRALAADRAADGRRGRDRRLRRHVPAHRRARAARSRSSRSAARATCAASPTCARRS